MLFCAFPSFPSWVLCPLFQFNVRGILRTVCWCAAHTSRTHSHKQMFSRKSEKKETVWNTVYFCSHCGSTLHPICLLCYETALPQWQLHWSIRQRSRHSWYMIGLTFKTNYHISLTQQIWPSERHDKAEAERRMLSTFLLGASLTLVFKFLFFSSWRKF